MKRHDFASACLAPALLAAPGIASAQRAAPDAGSRLFERCAACHLPTGQGVPGAFPPLARHIARLASTKEGRSYLAMVPLVGLNGKIVVEGSPYSGVMPPQGLTEAETAAVLNHVLVDLAKAGRSVKPFSAAEVGALRIAKRGVSSNELSRMRPATEAGR